MAPADKARAPTPPPEPRVLSLQVDDEARLTNEVNARLGHAGRVIDQIDPKRLASDHREMFASVQDFLAKAKEALVNRDLPRAAVLSDKAAKLADELAAATR